MRSLVLLVVLGQTVFLAASQLPESALQLIRLNEHVCQMIDDVSNRMIELQHDIVDRANEGITGPDDPAIVQRVGAVSDDVRAMLLLLRNFNSQMYAYRHRHGYGISSHESGL